MPWQILWDNGIDCGTWHYSFDTEESAQEYCDSITQKYISEGVWDEDCTAEPIWVDWLSSENQIENDILEQSYDYFNRYVAGDR